MDTNSINQKVKLAEETASGISDAELKVKTFELVLTHLLTQEVPNATNRQEVDRTVSSSVPGDTPIGKVASWLEVDPGSLGEVFEQKDNEFELKIPHSKIPTKIADAQRFLALIKVAIEKQGFGTPSVPARTLVSVCREYSCVDGNFAANIKDYDDFVLSKGAKGKMKSYEIRRKGLEKASDEIKSIIKN